MLVVDLDGAVVGERAYGLLLSALVGVLLQTGIPFIEFFVADEFDLRDEGLGELHASLITLERHVDRHHEVGNLISRRISASLRCYFPVCTQN